MTSLPWNKALKNASTNMAPNTEPLVTTGFSQPEGQPPNPPQTVIVTPANGGATFSNQDYKPVEVSPQVDEFFVLNFAKMYGIDAARNFFSKRGFGPLLDKLQAAVSAKQKALSVKKAKAKAAKKSRKINRRR